jgi:hypothetical protein
MKPSFYSNEHLGERFSSTSISISIFDQARQLFSSYKGEITKERLQRRLFSGKIDKMTNEFPPAKVRAIVSEVATLLKEKKETVSVAETVCSFLRSLWFLCQTAC